MAGLFGFLAFCSDAPNGERIRWKVTGVKNLSAERMAASLRSSRKDRSSPNTGSQKSFVLNSTQL